MTERIKKLNELQDRALKAAEEHNFNCTLMLCPGSGKTMTSFRCVYRLLELGLIHKGQLVIYNAERRSREKVLFNEDPDNLGEVYKFKKFRDKNITEDFDFRFHCYQSKPDEIYNNFINAAVVINDEAHDMLTPTRHPILTKSKCRYNINLTGAMGLDAHVFSVKEGMERMIQSDTACKIKEIGPYVTKGQILEMFAPVAIKYTTSEAITDGVIADFKTYKIEHKLDTKKSDILIWKKRKKYGTEQQYWEQKYDYAAGPNSWTNPKGVDKNIMVFDLPSFLYTLPSKDDVVKAILKRTEGEKTIVFGERISILQRILGEDAVMTPKNQDELTDKFNSGEVKVIGSAQIIAQGSNLNGVQNIIFHSYVGKWDKVWQRRARVRWLDGEQAKLFFIVTEGTFEEDRYKPTVVTKKVDGKIQQVTVNRRIKGWFSTLQEERDSKKNLIQIHDLNIVSKVKSETLLNWYKNQQ